MIKARSLFCITAVVMIAAMGLTACDMFAPKEVLPQGGNPLPTPREGTQVGTEAGSQAAATPEDTIKRYLQDGVAEQLAIQLSKITLRERYQDPALTAKDLKGLVKNVEILEDRTAVKKPKDTAATANVDLDIRVTYANGDTKSQTCKYDVYMQQGKSEKGDTVWYVVNPDAFPLFVNCK